MIYVTKDGGKTILYGKADDKDDAYDLVTDKNDVVVYREVDTGKEYVYNEDEWYEFNDSGSGGGGGGGGGGAYDIIFQVKSSPTGYIIPDEITISDVQIASGSLQEVEQKLLNGERVNGLFELITSYRGNGYDTYICWQLVSANTVYCDILFGGNAFIGDNSYDNVQIHYTSAYELDDIIFGN